MKCKACNGEKILKLAKIVKIGCFICNETGIEDRNLPTPKGVSTKELYSDTGKFLQSEWEKDLENFRNSDLFNELDR